MTQGHQLPPSGKPEFLSIGRTAEKLVVRSPIEWWISHFDLPLKRSRRCGGPLCALCAQGAVPVLRFVMRVDRSSGTPALLELRERHRPVLELMQQGANGQVGAMIEVRKAGFAVNSKIEVEYLGHRSCLPISVSKLVQSLGLPPILTDQPKEQA